MLMNPSKGTPAKLHLRRNFYLSRSLYHIHSAPLLGGPRQQNLRGGGAVLGVATQVAARSLDDLVDVDQPETVPLV